MPGRNTTVGVLVVGEAEMDRARKDIARDLERIGKAADKTVDEIRDAFEKLSPELDTTEIRRALDLAEQLDGMTASFTVDTDLDEIREAEQIARSLRSFQGRVDLSVEGRAELAEALDLADKLDQIRQVKVQVQGREDLERAEAIARDLDGKKITIPIDADVDGLASLEGDFAQAGDGAASAFADGFDAGDLGGSLSDMMLGGLAMAGPWAAAAVTLGAAFADDFGTGFNRGFSGTARSDLVVSLANALDEADMRLVGNIAGRIYGDGLGEGTLESVRQVTATIESELRDVDTTMDLEKTTRLALSLAEVFAVDVVEAIRAADSMVTRGLSANAEDAFNTLFSLGQQTGLEFEEAMEVVDEMGAAITALGIDGEQGLFMIGEAIRRDVYPQVDQAGEIFEEFNEIVATGGAAEAIQNIGLNAAEMQDKVADGRGAEAMAEIARQLLSVEDSGDRAAAAAEIFGSNMALSTNKDVALQLLAQADALRGVGEQGYVAADGLAATQTEWDKMSKSIESGAVQLGSAVATGFNRVKEFTEAIPGIGESASGSEAKLEGLGLKLGSTSEALSKVAEDSGETTTGVALLSDEVARLDALLSEFSGRFDADQVFRSIEEDALAATEATAGLTTQSYELGTGFDISTEAGRNAEAAIEGLSGNLDTLLTGYENGTVSAPQFAAGQAQIEASVRQVAAQMGFTQAETDDLIRKYGLVPREIRTTAGLDRSPATQSIRQLESELRGIPNRTVTANVDNSQGLRAVTALQNAINNLRGRTVTASVGTSVGISGAARRHSGGPIEEGRPYITGGPGAEELLVPGSDGYIFNPRQTAGILAGRSLVGGRGGGGGGGAPAPMVLEIRSAGSVMDDALLEMFRKAVKNRGGGVVRVIDG